MRLKIHVFDNLTDAQRLKDEKGSAARLYDCTDGARIYDFAAKGFSGNTRDHVWIVVVED